MKLRYVASKSKFIDIDAERPRLLKMETAYKLLQQHGIDSPEQVLAEALASPIHQEPKEPAYRTHLKHFDVKYKQDLWYIQGVALSLQQASDMLVSRGLDLSTALRVLAFAVDLEQRNK